MIKEWIEGTSWLYGKDEEIINFSNNPCGKCGGKIELIKKLKEYSSYSSGNLTHVGDSYFYRCIECNQVYEGSVIWLHID